MSAGSDLCSGCGLCCDGSLFQAVSIAPGEMHRMRALNLPVRAEGPKLQLLQPCPAHRMSSCGIYKDRPARCAQFRCDLLEALEAGTVPLDEAVRCAGATRRAVNRLSASVGPRSEALFTAAARIAEGPDTPRRADVLLDLGVAVVLVRRHIKQNFGKTEGSVAP
jgi:uncharacterized protein